MAEVSVSSSLQTIQFRKDLFMEWSRNNRLSPYSGRGELNVICQKMGDGPTLRHPLVTRLTNNGVSGSTMLRGAGVGIGNYSMDTNPTYYRNAIEFNKEDMEKTNLELMTKARPLLLQWMKDQTRNRQIQGLGAVMGATYSNLALTSAAFETIADAWLVANDDRVIFGASAGSGTDFSADIGQIDATNDTFTYSRADDMRRLAEDADPHIHPYSTNEEGEVYVVFCGSATFNTLKASLLTVNTGADVRGMKITSGGNIIGRDGDLYYNGMVFRKIPEISQIFSKAANATTGAPQGALYNTGAGLAVNVEPVFLCGMQALVHGIGSEGVDIIVDRDYDYKFRPGVAVEVKEDIKKAFFNGIQHGMVSGFFYGGAS